MTALESAEEVEAITAIVFLLSLVIKRYCTPSLYCTQYLAFTNWLQLVVALLFTTLAIHIHVIFLFCSVPDGIIHSKFSKSCQVLVKILGDNASDGSPGLLRPVC